MSHANAQVAIAHLVVSGCTLYKNKPVLKLIVRFLFCRNSSAITRNEVSLPKLCVKCLFLAHFELLIKI